MKQHVAFDFNTLLAYALENDIKHLDVTDLTNLEKWLLDRLYTTECRLKQLESDVF